MSEKAQPFYCYLDDFDLVTIIVPIHHYRETDRFVLIGNDEVIDLKLIERLNLGPEMKLVFSFDAYILLNLPYQVKNDRNETALLRTGKIVRTELFDNIYYYRKNDLGITYQPDATKFKLWSPVAKSIRLELIHPSGVTDFYPLEYQSSGIWRLKLQGDFDGCQYRYHARMNGKETQVIDPYAIASTANAESNIVVDKSKFRPMEATIDFSGNPLDAVVMEINVRDFSMDPEVPFCHRGKFLGLIETGLKTAGGNPAGFDYLKHLGITHVQLMPVLDFAGVDELDPDRIYNWGYNPIQYFVPEGWYATNPMDPYSRINEFREMVDTFHQANIGVILDVVFNHVYDLATFPLELLAPGYAFRVDREGIHTALSGCKNDLATERKMVRKLILDAVLYWATEFKIDGFRFDLMGLIDFMTMNEIRQELEDVNPKILVYGEGWKMQTGNESDRMAHLANKKVLHTLGFFNDRFRDQVKGNTFIVAEKGYATGDLTKAEDVAEWMLGGARHRLLFKYTSQSVNYVECHDNLTLYAKILQIHPDEILAKKQSMLATAMTLLSLGMPFLHLGQEFFRTKGFMENSFQAGDDINQIVWKDTDASQAAIRLVSQFIQIRHRHAGFRLKSHSDLIDNATAIVLPSKTILMTLRAETELILCFKPTTVSEEITLPKDAELLVASSDEPIKNHSGIWRLSDIGTCLFQRKDKQI